MAKKIITYIFLFVASLSVAMMCLLLSLKFVHQVDYATGSTRVCVSVFGKELYIIDNPVNVFEAYGGSYREAGKNKVWINTRDGYLIQLYQKNYNYNGGKALACMMMLGKKFPLIPGNEAVLIKRTFLYKLNVYGLYEAQVYANEIDSNLTQRLIKE